MITWMQKHKSYLIVTIWISTIAFVGAGFVGWGQYDYGHKSGAIAQIGEVKLTQGELQKSYSQLYSRYNEMFQGNFDEEKAKTFGLQKQAFKQLREQALLLNLALEYDLSVNDSEILSMIITQNYFFQDNVFNKEVYKQVLSRNNLTMSEYEADIKKQLLITKVINLLPIELTQSEKKISDTIISIADKIEYKVLTDKEITVDTTDKLVQAFWETKKSDYMTDVNYEISYFIQDKISLPYDDTKIRNYYNDNKTHFKDSNGKIQALEKAKDDVITELNEKATKDMALRSYIAYKKNKLDSNVSIKTTSISASNNIFNQDVLEQISKISLTSPYLKPIRVNGEYLIVKLTKTIPSKIKSFKDAKDAILPLYIATTKENALLELANSLLESFKGIKTDFITAKDSDKISELTINSSNEFLEKLFNSKSKKHFIKLNDGKIILYNILEQKLLTSNDISEDNSFLSVKSNIFNESLINSLKNRYNTEIFVEGLSVE